MKLTIIVAVSIILAGVIPSLAFHENTGTFTVATMCSIQENFTANCDEKWIWVYFEDILYVQEPETEIWSGAYAIHSSVEDGEKYSICNTFSEVREYGDEFCSLKWFVLGNGKTDSCWSERCYPLVWHEIKHLVCECNWHYGLTNKNGFTDLPKNDV